MPDVVVLDVILPDGSGLDFIGELREFCEAPVLLLTLKDERDDIWPVCVPVEMITSPSPMISMSFLSAWPRSCALCPAVASFRRSFAWIRWS